MKRILLALLLVIVSAAGAWAIDDLDATVPANSALISTFASYERETRAKINEILDNMPDVQNWEVVTVAHTAASGEKLAVNTSAAACTVTLPASPVAGNYITLGDAKGTWATYNVTLSRNGSMINGAASNYTLSESGIYFLVYVDAGYGWVVLSAGSSTGSAGGLPTEYIKLSSYSYTNFYDVVTAIGATPTVLLIDADMTLSTSVSVSKTLQLLPILGHKITVGSGKVLTLNSPGQVLATRQQVFVTTALGQVAFTNPGLVYPEWWGAACDGSTDNAFAFNSAFNSMPQMVLTSTVGSYGGVVSLDGGQCNVASALTASGAGLYIIGQGPDASLIYATSALGSGTVLTLDSSHDGSGSYPGWQPQQGYKLADFGIVTNHIDTSAIEVKQSYVRANEINHLHLYVASGYTATNTGTGVKDNGETGYGSSNGIKITNCDISGFKYGVHLYGRAGGSVVSHNFIEGVKTNSGSTGILIDGSENNGIDVVEYNYIQAWDYGIKNYHGYYSRFAHNFIESGTITTAEYDDNSSGTSRAAAVQAYLINNSWSDCTKVTSDWSSIRQEACANVLSGRKTTSGQLTQTGATPFIKGTTDTFTTTAFYQLFGTVGTGANTDPFGQTITLADRIGALSSSAWKLRIGTVVNANHPIEFYTGSILRATLGPGSLILDLDDEIGTVSDFIMQVDYTAADPWGDNATDATIRPYMSLAAPYAIKLGPTGHNNNYRTDIRAYDSVALGHYSPIVANGNGVQLTSANVPVIETTACTANQMAWDTTNEYRCVSTNLWKQEALSPFGYGSRRVAVPDARTTACTANQDWAADNSTIYICGETNIWKKATLATW